VNHEAVASAPGGFLEGRCLRMADYVTIRDTPAAPGRRASMWLNCFLLSTIISFRSTCSCRRCAKNVGGLGIPTERRFLKRLAPSGIGGNERLKRDFESPTELIPGDVESRAQIAGPQSPISKMLEFSVDLI